MENSDYSYSLNASSKAIIVIISVISTTLGIAIITIYFNFTQYIGYIVFGSIISATIAIIYEGNIYVYNEPDFWEYIAGLTSSFFLSTGASLLWFTWYWIIIGAANVYILLSNIIGMDVTMIPKLFSYNLTRYPAIFLFYIVAAMNCNTLLNQLFPDEPYAKSAFSDIVESENKVTSIVIKKILPLFVIILLFIVYNSISIEFESFLITLLINRSTITFYLLGIHVLLSTEYYTLIPTLPQEQSTYNILNSLYEIFQSIGCIVEILPSIQTSDYVDSFKNVDLLVETDQYIYLMNVYAPGYNIPIYKQDNIPYDLPYNLLYASWEYRKKYGNKELNKIIRPALVFVGMEPNSMIRAFSLKEDIEIIEIPYYDIISEMLWAEDEEIKRSLISRFFGMNFHDVQLSETFSDVVGGEEK